MKEHTLTAQLQLGLDWSKHPWNGHSPRWLRNVDNPRTFPKPATVDETYADPAQYMLFIPSSLLEGPHGS